MIYNIYGTSHEPTRNVFYGTVDTIDQATVEMRKLRESGMSKVYAIGLNYRTVEAHKSKTGTKSKADIVR